ncbi:unnamed protein product [Dibothriocephalus latus]|uniref:G-protein coupled receptors family 1 profile domain-containing protein n=1 Tax=Dibothriocephalus latus TaxID=60516 RepID=A0A3P6QB59_DIBLA|nr:unnamed protein product [Dibothriocephalus latus]
MNASANVVEPFEQKNTPQVEGSVDSSESASKLLMLCVACLGLFTNTLIVLVLCHFRGSRTVGGGERSARVNLLGLAIADFCICLSTLPLIYSKRSFESFDFLLYYTLFGPGLVSTFLTVSAWMVVLVSLLRYLAVCWPIRSRFYLRCRSVVNAIIGLYFAAFVFNLPLFLRYTYEENEEDCSSDLSIGNSSVCSNSKRMLHIVDRTFPLADLLKDIYSIAHIICTNVGPFVAVLVTNISVIIACRRSEDIRLRFGAHQQPAVPRPAEESSNSGAPGRPKQGSTSSKITSHASSQTPSNKRQPKIVIVKHKHLRPRALHRVTPLLLAVIFAFLLLSTPFGIVQFVCLKLINNIGIRIRKDIDLRRQYVILNTLLEWTNFLQVFGCAVNFFLYFMVSRTFRRTTRRTFTRIFNRCRQKHGLSHLAAYMCSSCCCEEPRSYKNEAYIVRVYSPVG